MSTPYRKWRPERMRPGLKQLTPIEAKKVKGIMAETRKRWEALFALNVWKPIK